MHLDDYERHGHNIMRRFTVSTTYDEYLSQLGAVKRADEHPVYGKMFREIRSKWFREGM